MKHAITLLVAVLLMGGGLTSCANQGPSVDDLIMMQAFGLQTPQQQTADRVEALENKIKQLEARQ